MEYYPAVQRTSSMKKFLSAAIAVTMLAGAGAASAQPQRNDGRDRDNRRYEAPGPSPKASPRAHQVHAERRAERRYAAARYLAPRGVQMRRYRAGELLPPQFRERVYIVDYRPYALPPPPPGYQYVRVGNDVALTATRTGLITSLVMDLFR
jgi:Ni/Co efflux regulator RcnB